MSAPSSLTYTEIKDKYFYRVARWDWLNEKMIHVYDPHGPRLITMDEWPQEVFLDAIGDKTVKEYMQEFYYRYPEGKAPKELNDSILAELNGLLDLKIIVLSDTPETLPETFLKPLSDQGTVDMLGTWEGTYTYGAAYGIKKEVAFTITISDVKDNTFSGTVKDDLTTGGTPGVGKISGKFTDQGISFDKNMPVHTYIDLNGASHNDATKKHPTLLYEGSFGHAKRFVSGVWQFRKKVWIWKGFIPYRVSRGWGEFTMKKKES